MVTTVTTREILAALKAESDVIKVEAMAQRSHHVHHRMAGGCRPGSHMRIEDFIMALEQEDLTDGTEPS